MFAELDNDALHGAACDPHLGIRDAENRFIGHYGCPQHPGDLYQASQLSPRDGLFDVGEFPDLLNDSKCPYRSSCISITLVRVYVDLPPISNRLGNSPVVFNVTLWLDAAFHFD